MFYTAPHTVTPTANPQTLLQIYAPTNQRIKVHGLDIGFRGSTPASAPIPLDWLVQGSAGTASSLSPQKQDRGLDASIQGTLTVNFTSEPSSSNVLVTFPLHPQTTALWRPPFPLIVKGGERVGLRWNSGVYVPVTFTLYLEE